MEYFLDDGDLEDVRHGRGKAFYVYGSVTYRDVFGSPHLTNFCQYAVWGVSGNLVAGFMTERHNDAD